MNAALTQANRLFDMGVDSAQLAYFGLSEAKAQLMGLLYTKQDRVSKTP